MCICMDTHTFIADYLLFVLLICYFGKGNGSVLQYSCLENPMGRGAWWAIVHGVTRVRHNLVTKPSPLLSYCRVLRVSTSQKQAHRLSCSLCFYNGK